MNVMPEQTNIPVSTLIQVIRDAEEPASVSNLMVAEALRLIYESAADVPSLRSRLDGISATLSAAISRFDSLAGENASEAIDNFNEILAFLAGMSDDTTLAAKLDRLRNMDIVHIHMFNGDDGTAHMQLCTVGDRTYTAPMHTATDYRDGVLSAVDFKRFDDACRAVDGGMPVRRVTEDGAEGIITPGLYWVSSGEAGHGLALLAVTRNPSSMPGALSYTVTQHRLAQGALMVREGVVRQVAGPSPALTVDWGEWGASGGNPPDISDFERRLSALEQGVVAEVPELTAEDIERIYAGLQQ